MELPIMKFSWPLGPGDEIVINEAVGRSGGITLAWVPVKYDKLDT